MKRRQSFVRAMVAMSAAGMLAAGCGASGAGVHSAEKTTKEPILRSCASYLALAAKPARCLTAADRAKISRAKKAAAKKAAAKQLARRNAAAAKAAARKAAAKKAAAAAAAAYAAANAWHNGYLGPTGERLDVYGRWDDKPACSAYAAYGCWHFEVITENGCTYLSVVSNETSNGAIVGEMLANQNDVPPKTPVILELDPDRAGVGAAAPDVTCDNF